MSMPRHLLVYLALVLAALLPLETADAVNGCAFVAAMDNQEKDCGDCIDDERQQCRAYCIALCQAFLAGHIQEIAAQEKAADDHRPHEAAFPKISSGGPEPPPPRMPVDRLMLISTELIS